MMVKYLIFYDGFCVSIFAYSYSEALIRAMEFFYEDDYNKIEVVALPQLGGLIFCYAE